MTWEEIYALYCVETGWSWDYVDEEMTLPRADGFLALWKHTPPLRVLVTAVAVALGMPAPSRASTKSSAPKVDLGSYLEAFSGAGMSVERVKKHG